MRFSYGTVAIWWMCRVVRYSIFFTGFWEERKRAGRETCDSQVEIWEGVYADAIVRRGAALSLIDGPDGSDRTEMGRRRQRLETECIGFFNWICTS